MLEQGRTLIFSLASASLDRLNHGVPDTWIAFGMAPADDAPTGHGCPGRAMANGTLLGLLTGLIESARVSSPGTPGLADLQPLR